MIPTTCPEGGKSSSSIIDHHSSSSQTPFRGALRTAVCKTIPQSLSDMARRGAEMLHHAFSFLIKKGPRVEHTRRCPVADNLYVVLACGRVKPNEQHVSCAQNVHIYKIYKYIKL